MSKKVTRRKKIGLPIILIIIILIVLIIVGVKLINKKDEKNENKVTNVVEQKQEENIEKEEYVQILEDGTKLNISEKLKQNKKIGNIPIKDIQLTYKNGMTTLLANVANNTNEIIKQKAVEITLIDKNGKKIYTLNGIIEEIKPNEEKQLNCSITADFANAYDFTIKEK